MMNVTPGQEEDTRMEKGKRKMNEVPHPGFDKPEEYETFTTTNDLEEAARNYTDSSDWSIGENLEHIDRAFIAGAKWQAEQLLKSSPLPEDTVLFNKGVEEGKRLAEEELSELLTIAHLQGADQMKEQMLKDGNVILTEEDFEAEKEKSMEWGYNLCKEQTEKRWLEDRDGCFWDGVEEGKKAMKEQMMKDAEPAEIGYFNHRGLSILTDKSIEKMPVSEGDKVRIIILPKED